jgi:hypothetical protein
MSQRRASWKRVAVAGQVALFVVLACAAHASAQAPALAVPSGYAMPAPAAAAPTYPMPPTAVVTFTRERSRVFDTLRLRKLPCQLKDDKPNNLRGRHQNAGTRREARDRDRRVTTNARHHQHI